MNIIHVDRKFSLLVRARAGWKCSRCNRDFSNYPERLHCSHFYGRRHMGTRFDLENCDAHCIGCHQHFGANPKVFRWWKLRQIGRDRFDELTVKAHSIAKIDLGETLRWINSELRRMRISA